MSAIAPETRLGPRLLTVTVVLLIVGVVTVALGTYILAAVDLVGAMLFFSLWFRRR